MSGKFFTWTKGDRRNAAETLRSGAVVPIPAECLSIRGMDFAKGKSRRNPLSLSLDRTYCSDYEDDGRASGSIALHDAAVQSATSLMAVMSDMLRSPQLSAHMSSQQQSGVSCGPSRQRSYTAPSTPLAEVATREPVELYASVPSERSSHLSLPPGGKTSSDARITSFGNPNSLGGAIPRPHTCPQESKPSPRGRGMDNNLADNDRLQPRPTLGTPRSISASPREVTDQEVTSVLQTAAGTDLGGDSDRISTHTSKPALSVTNEWPPCSPMFARHASSTNVLQRAKSLSCYGEDADADVLDDIAQLRASHEAHLTSLKFAHEKELASHRSYITFLEKRTSNKVAVQQRPPTLTLDTSHTGSRADQESELSTTTVTSFETCLDDQRRASREAVAETETLKRKLSLFRKAQQHAVEIRRERDLLRDAADRSDRRIAQLKDIVRKAKSNEKELRNRGVDIEARLVAANNERLDVLEGFDDACSALKVATERERQLSEELAQARSQIPLARKQTTTPGEDLSPPYKSERPAFTHNRTRSDASPSLGTPFCAHDKIEQLLETRRLLAARDEEIQKLTQAVSEHHENSKEHQRQQERIVELEGALHSHQEQLAAARSDAEQFNSLLHNELRRQARHAGQHDRRGTSTEAKARMLNVEKANMIQGRAASTSTYGNMEDRATTHTSGNETNMTSIEVVKSDLDYCIEEIVMYKLDVRGYKKDLKKAHAELEILRAQVARPPPTPDRDSLSSVRSSRSIPTSIGHHAIGKSDNGIPVAETNVPGLGISSSQPPRTPTRAKASKAASMTTLASPLTSPPPSATAKSPHARVSLNSNKELPQPPSQSRTAYPLSSPSRSQWPEQDVKRTETIRSLSESIISSYARTQEPGLSTTGAGPSSVPLGSPSVRRGTMSSCNTRVSGTLRQ